MGFYVGQKVICVDGSRPNTGNFGPMPVKNEIYTICRMGIPLIDKIPTPTLDLIELDGAWGKHPAWRASRFRPLVSTKTDISIFTAMLGPRQKETVDDR